MTLLIASPSNLVLPITLHFGALEPGRYPLAVLTSVIVKVGQLITLSMKHVVDCLRDAVLIPLYSLLHLQCGALFPDHDVTEPRADSERDKDSIFLMLGEVIFLAVIAEVESLARSRFCNLCPPRGRAIAKRGVLTDH